MSPAPLLSSGRMAETGSGQCLNAADGGVRQRYTIVQARYADRVVTNPFLTGARFPPDAAFLAGH